MVVFRSSSCVKSMDFDRVMHCAAENGYIDIVKLCRGWLGYDLVHEELSSNVGSTGKFMKKYYQ